MGWSPTALAPGALSFGRGWLSGFAREPPVDMLEMDLWIVGRCGETEAVNLILDIGSERR